MTSGTEFYRVGLTDGDSNLHRNSNYQCLSKNIQVYYKSTDVVCDNDGREGGEP